MKKIAPFVRLLRPTQWTKNVFVLAPLLFSFKLGKIAFFSPALLATVVFCLTASALYIINDFVDMEADGKHAKKSRRPLARGEITKPQALIVCAVLLILVVFFSVYAGFGRTFWIFLGLYAALSLAYSFGLKHVSLLELFILASGYMFRLLAGCAAIHELPSSWILAATGTIALLIAAGKRRAEMAENHDPQQMRRSLKQYNLPFLDSVITMLAGVTIVTYLLFTTSDYALDRYHSPYFVATSVFVLYGVLRYLQLVKVMGGADDPTTLILTDRSLCIAVIGWIVTCVGFIYFSL
jgi:4-hydroxybenzoate polyprenyltransferase